MRLTRATPGTALADAVEEAARAAARKIVLRALRESRGQCSRAASLLGVSRPAVLRLVDALGLAADLDAVRERYPREGPGRPPTSRRFPPAF